LALLGAAAASQGQPIDASWDVPTLDRWMYAFSGTPGIRFFISTFASPQDYVGLDDRDAQFIVGFDTGDQVPAGLGATAYQVQSVRLTVTIANDLAFEYDPTHDALETYIADTDAEFVPDSDPGRPIELFGLAYRDGWDLSTWTETTTFFSSELIADPAEGTRTAYAAAFDDALTPTDISRNVRTRLEVTPWAVGTMPLAPGDLVPTDTVVSFDVDLDAPGALAYVQHALDFGRLNLVVSSLHPATGGPGGGIGDPTYPSYYSRENPIAQAFGFEASLEISVVAGSCAADLNGDGSADVLDFFLFVAAFASGDPVADINGDGRVDVLDFFAFVTAFQQCA